jgi:hypothetical protein
MQTNKPLTIEQFARMGGRARARKYSKKQLRAWARLGGRPKAKGKK